MSAYWTLSPVGPLCLQRESLQTVEINTVCQLFSVAMDRAETRGPWREGYIRPSDSLWPPTALIEDDRKREKACEHGTELGSRQCSCGAGQFLRPLYLFLCHNLSRTQTIYFSLSAAGFYCVRHKGLSEARQSRPLNPRIKVSEWHLEKYLHIFAHTFPHIVSL